MYYAYKKDDKRYTVQVCDATEVPQRTTARLKKRNKKTAGFNSYGL